MAALGYLSSSGPTARADDLGPAIIVDSLGNQIGPYLNAGPSGDVVLRKISSHWFSLPVTRQGFEDNAQVAHYSFTTSDCSGIPYLGIESGVTVRGGGITL
jgi:hypothetical protein